MGLIRRDGFDGRDSTAVGFDGVWIGECRNLEWGQQCWFEHAVAVKQAADQVQIHRCMRRTSFAYLQLPYKPSVAYIDGSFFDAWRCMRIDVNILWAPSW